MSAGWRRQLWSCWPLGWEKPVATLPGSVATGFSHPSGSQDQSWRLQPGDIAAMILHLLTYPPHALPSLVEMRPAKPPKQG